MNTRMEFHPMQVCLALMTFQFPITRTGSKAGSCTHRDNIRV